MRHCHIVLFDPIAIKISVCARACVHAQLQLKIASSCELAIERAEFREFERSRARESIEIPDQVLSHRLHHGY
jgi:hypothetical protein